MGIGGLLLEKIIDKAKKNHISAIFLEFLKPFNGAKVLYEKYGFVETGKIINFHGTNFYEMSKKLL